MGKVRRQRKKFHLEPKTGSTHPQTEKSSLENISTPELAIKPQDNVFAGLNIDITSLKNLSDDTRSVKSFKSLKSDSGKVLSKKDKLKLRREMLLQKFEVIKQQKQLSKKKKTAVVGDLNPLKDALPSLESLLKSRGNVLYKGVQSKKKRGIEKVRTIKKKQLQGIKMFQMILKSKQYQTDPQMSISQHIKAVLDQEKNNVGGNK